MKLKDLLHIIIGGQQVPQEELAKMSKEEMEDLNKALELLNDKLYGLSSLEKMNRKEWREKTKTPIGERGSSKASRAQEGKKGDADYRSGSTRVAPMKDPTDLEYPSGPDKVDELRSRLREERKSKVESEANKKKAEIDFNMDRRKDHHTRKLIDENKNKAPISPLKMSEDGKKEDKPELDYKDTTGYADSQKQKPVIHPADSKHFDIDNWDKKGTANVLAASEDDVEVLKCDSNGQWSLEKWQDSGVYDEADNARRKANNVEEGGPEWKTMQRTKRYSKAGGDRKQIENKKLDVLNRKQPVKVFTPEEIAEYNKNKK